MRAVASSVGIFKTNSPHVLKTSWKMYEGYPMIDVADYLPRKFLTNPLCLLSTSQRKHEGYPMRSISASESDKSYRIWFFTNQSLTQFWKEVCIKNKWNNYKIYHLKIVILTWNLILSLVKNIVGFGVKLLMIALLFCLTVGKPSETTSIIQRIIYWKKN